MIGRLPVSVDISGKDFRIRTDYRVVLIIFIAFKDVELTEQEKTSVMFDCLYEQVEQIEPDMEVAAIEQANWFLDGGSTTDDDNPAGNQKPLIDWEQDEQMIFAAINKVAGREVRNDEYLHWWTFLGYFNSLGECLLNSVISIRDKKNHGKKLDKGEQEYYKKNKSLIDLKVRYTKKELEDKERLDDLI